MQSCCDKIKSWMNSNFLKLNTDKTEVMVFGKKSQLQKLNIGTIRIGDTEIKPALHATNIGVVLDTNLSMVNQVNKMVASAWYQLHNISRIRKYLTTEASQILIHAYVISKLDTYNCVLSGIPMKLVDKLKRVQHAAAKCIAQARKYDSITAILRNLHWLPISKRIEFKILLITYKALNEMAPAYLKELITVQVSRQPPRKAKDDGAIMLQIPKTRYVKYGDRAFCVIAPKLWNTLPGHIRNCTSVELFKRELKTHLFTLSYN